AAGPCRRAGPNTARTAPDWTPGLGRSPPDSLSVPPGTPSLAGHASGALRPSQGPNAAAAVRHAAGKTRLFRKPVLHRLMIEREKRQEGRRATMTDTASASALGAAMAVA